MAHLISPIDIAGTDYCCKCEGGRSTKGVLTTDYASPNGASITTDCGIWDIFSGGEADDEGEISIGVSCGSNVELEFALSVIINPTDEWIVDVDVYKDGVFFGAVALSDLQSRDTITVTMTGGPCGTIITAYAYPTATDDAYDVTVTMEVLSIT